MLPVSTELRRLHDLFALHLEKLLTKGVISSDQRYQPINCLSAAPVGCDARAGKGILIDAVLPDMQGRVVVFAPLLGALAPPTLSSERTRRHFP